MSETAQSTALATVVAVVDEFTVVINRGVLHDVKVGNRFLIFGVGDEIFDPETKESLGALELVKGLGSVTHVQEKMCTVKSARTRAATPTIKTIKRTPKGNLGLAVFGSFAEETVEERQGDPSTVPFDDPRPGDKARPV